MAEYDAREEAKQYGIEPTEGALEALTAAYRRGVIDACKRLCARCLLNDTPYKSHAGALWWTHGKGARTARCDASQLRSLLKETK